MLKDLPQSHSYSADSNLPAVVLGWTAEGRREEREGAETQESSAWQLGPRSRPLAQRLVWRNLRDSWGQGQMQVSQNPSSRTPQSFVLATQGN